MGQCKDCKFWNKPMPIFEGGKTPKRGSCKRAESSQSEANDKKSKAIAYGNDGWASWLSTLPSFGCNQFRQTQTT